MILVLFLCFIVGPFAACALACPIDKRETFFKGGPDSAAATHSYEVDGDGDMFGGLQDREVGDKTWS